MQRYSIADEAAEFDAMRDTPKPQHRLSINTKIVGKCAPQDLSHAGAWQQVSLTMEGLAEHIGKGHPWMAALLNNGGERWQANANYAEIVGVDIDAGMMIEEALNNPFIAAHCALLIESASSKPEHHKFRLVFVFPAPIEGWENIRRCNRYLIDLIGVADKACKDASRFFFGAPGREPILVSSATLPDDFLDRVMAWDAELEAIAARELAARAEYLATLPVTDQAELAKSALECIPPYTPGNGTYNDLIVMMAGVLNDLGSEGEALLEAWGGFGRDTAKKMQGLICTPNKKATLGSLFHLAKEYGFRFPKREFTADDKRAYAKLKQEERQQATQGNHQPVSKPQGKLVPIKRGDAPKITYEAAIRDLAAKGYLPYDTLVFEQNAIAEQHGKTAIDVKTAYSAVTSLLAELETRQDVKQGIDQYLVLAQAQLDLRTMLPDNFVECLEELGELLGTSPEVMLTTMLPAVASLCKIGTRLKLGQSGYYAKPIFWGATIIPSGGNKSGTQRTVLSPLEAIQSEAMQRYDAEFKRYQRDLKAWEKADKKTRGEMYDEPKPARRYILKRATKQALIKIQCQQPEHGLLVFRDELSGWFNSMSEHAKGNSDDFDFWCEAKNGDGFIDDTKSSGNAYSVASSVSVCGGTQPQTIQRLMGDFSDGQGMWARFGPCFVERKRRARPSMTGREISIFDWLKDTYERIAALPDVTYLMNSDAYEIWAEYSDELKDLTEAESRDALCSVYSKHESESGTMVMLFHLLNAALRGEAPTANISADMAFAGVTFSKFMLGQVHQLHRLGDEKRGEVDAVLAKIIEKAKHLGGRITWKQARSLRALDVEKYGGKKGQATRPQVEKHFAQLESLGYGSTDGDGDHFGFTLAPSREQTVSKDQMSYDFNYPDAERAS
jgi:hypothetical protein